MHTDLFISIIIPVGSGETHWRKLLPCLTDLPWPNEIIVVATEPAPLDWSKHVESHEVGNAIRWIHCEPGRAHQLNRGANAASGRFLWFLHADSIVPPAAVTALDQALRERPHSFHYFRLKFHSDGPPGMALNAAGVWFRSRWLGMPFGDQGFCLDRATFQELNGYDETAVYGEDHLFVWKARQRGIRLNGIREPILTSARKYRKHGWLRTTTRHVILTFRQAIPQFWRLIRKRIRSWNASQPPSRSS